MPGSDRGPRETAIRLASYRPFEPLGPAHVASCGVRAVEFHLPRDDAEHAQRMEALTKHSLRAVSLQGRLDFSDPDVAGQFEPQLERMQAFDCTRMLLAFPPPKQPLPEVAGMLRTAAELADQVGVTLMLETHPNLFHNTATTRQTLSAVAHRAAQVNFDPANVLFYNEMQLDPVEELRGLHGVLSGIHLKDTPGGFGNRHFAELGSGIIDFPGIYATLQEMNYEAPCTIEIEGIEGEDRTETTVIQRVEASLQYLENVAR